MRSSVRLGARLGARVGVASALLIAGGCGVELEHGLEERQANQVAAVLDEHGVAADKVRDDSVGWKIVVPRAELARSFKILDSYDLPRRDRKGLGEALSEHSLLPSLAEEQARLETARAAELERTLERAPGIVSARVHLALPDSAALDGQRAAARASVLLRTDGASALDATQVKALVAGATQGLRAEAVEVIFASGRPPAPQGPVETVGPVGSPGTELEFAL